MYRFAVTSVLSAALLSGALLSATGCATLNTPKPKCGAQTCPPSTPTKRIGFELDIEDLATSDLLANSQLFDALFDTDSTLSYVPGSSQLVITVLTDNGQTFSQTFNAAPANASGFTSAGPDTTTYAFAAQSPQSLSSFVNSAASAANSTVTVNIQMIATFNGPSDGADHTIYGRSYLTNYGAQDLGSFTYTAPTMDGGPPSQVDSISGN